MENKYKYFFINNNIIYIIFDIKYEITYMIHLTY